MDPDRNFPTEVLENLPYLIAAIKEAFRFDDWVATCLERSSSEKPMRFIDRYRSGNKEYFILPQTLIGMTSFHIFQDEFIFPDVGSFISDWWIVNPGFSRFLGSFSRGSKSFQGIRLAYAKIYLCLSAIFRRCGSGGKDGVREEGDDGALELIETGFKDVQNAADFFVLTSVERPE